MSADASMTELVRAFAEQLTDRQKAPRATVYGYASVRAHRQVGRELLKILNTKGKRVMTHSCTRSGACLCAEAGMSPERRLACAWTREDPAPPPPSSADAWDVRWLRIAAEVASWSKDPSSKVGAVAVRDRRQLASGFNGFPVGMKDDPTLLADRAQKYPRIVHAEQNVIAWAAREGTSLRGASLYVSPFHPCPDCAKMIVQAGFAEVVYLAGAVPDRWADAFKLSGEILSECGVLVRGVAL